LFIVMLAAGSSAFGQWQLVGSSIDISLRASAPLFEASFQASSNASSQGGANAGADRGASCAVDADCKSDQECLQDECCPRAGECVADQDCPKSTQCQWDPNGAGHCGAARAVAVRAAEPVEPAAAPPAAPGR